MTSYVFSHFDVNGQSMAGPEITLQINSDVYITAVYQEKAAEVCDLTVLVSDTEGTPISGATVLINGFGGVTNGNGIILFPSLPVGSHSWTVTAPGYHPAQGTADCPTPQPYMMTIILVPETEPPPTPSIAPLIAVIGIVATLLPKK